MISARALSIGVVFVLDALIIGVLFRLLSGLKPSARAMWSGAVLGAVALTVLQQLSFLFVGAVTRNPLYTSFASIIALLIWLNLSAQVILIAGAYIVTGVAEEEDRVRARHGARRSRSGACSRRKTWRASRTWSSPTPAPTKRRSGQVPETVPTYRAAQVRAAEAPLLAAGEPLMKRAAAALAAMVREELADAAHPRVLVLAGSGDNGGDALFAAASLAAARRWMCCSCRTGSTRRDWRRRSRPARSASTCRRRGTRHPTTTSSSTGSSGSGRRLSALRGTARDVVEALLPAVRAGRPRVVAVDLPSGLHPDTGEADDAVLPAAVTVTMGAVKAGLVSGRGPELCGRVVLVDIGLGKGLADEVQVGEASVDRVVKG